MRLTVLSAIAGGVALGELVGDVPLLGLPVWLALFVLIVWESHRERGRL